jgi:hypothetical protein
MKRIFSILAFCILSLVQAQDSIRYIGFTRIENDNEENEYDSIAFKTGDKIRHEFELKGRQNIKCALTVLPKGMLLLSQYTESKWQALESLYYNILPAENGEYITPSMEISDFNKDGNEDFRFSGLTNVNGNQWEQIYLNHPHNGRLEILKTTPDEGDTWCAADYDTKTGIISCTLVSGAFGASEEYTYKLEGFTAKPLYKERVNNTGVRYQQFIHYKGIDNAWQITNQDILFSVPEDDERFAWYRVRQENDSIVLLMQCPDRESTNCKTIYTIEVSHWLPEYSSDDSAGAPYFKITDFNEDGYDDLLVCTYSSVHAIVPMRIFLYDPKKQNLTELINTAEPGGVWMSPEYDAKNNTIHCFFDAGNAFNSYKSTYKLKGFTANPVEKHEVDRTNFNPITGEGYEVKDYKGKNGKWILKK